MSFDEKRAELRRRQQKANAMGSPSGRWMYIGCLAFCPGTFFHS